MRALYLLLLLPTLSLAAGSVAAESAPRDPYLEGYATAVMERDLDAVVREVEVRGGSARIVLDGLGAATATDVAELVERIDGIDRVEVTLAGDPGEAVRVEGADLADDEAEPARFDLLPRHELFDPLLADPRQPHFSAIYQWYLDDPELTRVGSANFGETFALLGGPFGDGRWEIGLLGGVFSIFDLDADSLDLVNSDFWVGPTISLRKGSLSTQVRIYHQSSHLGDEFLLRNRTERVNLSYEGIDWLGSLDLPSGFRVYGGGGVIVHDEPNLDPWSAQAGAEWYSPVAFASGRVRPVAAFDFQVRDENDWREELGAAVGLEFSNSDTPGPRLQLLVTWFEGNSPNGQFFERRIENVGVGAHLHF